MDLMLLGNRIYIYVCVYAEHSHPPSPISWPVTKATCLDIYQAEIAKKNNDPEGQRNTDVLNEVHTYRYGGVCVLRALRRSDVKPEFSFLVGCFLVFVTKFFYALVRWSISILPALLFAMHESLLLLAPCCFLLRQLPFGILICVSASVIDICGFASSGTVEDHWLPVVSPQESHVVVPI